MHIIVDVLISGDIYIYLHTWFFIVCVMFTCQTYTRKGIQHMSIITYAYYKVMLTTT